MDPENEDVVELGEAIAEGDTGEIVEETIETIFGVDI